MSTVFSVVEKFQGLLEENLKFKFSKGRNILGQKGIPNRLFVFHLCQDQKLFLDFLREAKIIKDSSLCEKCNFKMSLRKKNTVSEGLKWVCFKSACGKKCRFEKSIRYGSWFATSRLKMEEVFLLTYELVRGSKTGDIRKEYFFSTSTLADWRQIVNETILYYIEMNSQRIGGADKIVEVEEGQFGKRKYEKEYVEESQWVLGGIERGSGKLFLVEITQRTQETLVEVVKEWIEPGTTIYFDSWRSHNCLTKKALEDLRQNYGIIFMDPDTRPRTDTDESVTKHMKGSRQMDFKFNLAYYMFLKSCKQQELDCFNKFLEIIRNEKWEETNISA